MTQTQARAMTIGDIVMYRGRVSRISSVATRGIAAPLFRLIDVESGEYLGLTSWELCGMVRP